MAIYSNTFTPNPQGVFPENAVDGQEWRRCEPLLTVEQLTRRFLFGVRLVSQQVNPMTGRYDVKTPDDLKDHIIRGMQQLEQDTHMSILPVQYEEQQPLDRTFIEQYGYMRLRNKPILSVDALVIRPANNVQGTDIYTVPREWLSFTHAVKGQINIVPLITADSSVWPQAQSANGAAFMLTFLAQIPWAASYWQVRYTAGFAEGEIPGIVNEAIGIYAALDILWDIIKAQTTNNYSLGLDGMSQSHSNSVPQNLKLALDRLETKKDHIVKKLKAYYGQRISVSTI